MMIFGKYLKLSRAVDLESTDKDAALKELALALCRSLNIRKQKSVITDMLTREDSVSTFIGQGVAIPQTKGKIKNDYAIVVGRSLNGVSFDAARGAKVHIIVLVMSKIDGEGNTLELTGEIASFFKSSDVQKLILSSKKHIDLKKLIASTTSGSSQDEKKSQKRPKEFSNHIISSALTISKNLKASAIMVFADVVSNKELLQDIKTRKKIIYVTSNKSRLNSTESKNISVIQSPSFPVSNRTSQIKIGILLALSRNYIEKNDRVICISGNPRIGRFDTILAIDLATEYEFFFTATKNMVLPQGVKPEIFERILGLASEIAVEGREGKPVGSIFVIGDTNNVTKYISQLIINPFRGYTEAERTVLDPALGETIKEFTAIDGAFIVTGDGVLLSAGTYLRPPPDDRLKLPSGLGSRHAGAAGITACTRSIAITISESTGMITIFKNGAIMMTMAKQIGSQKGFIEEPRHSTLET